MDSLGPKTSGASVEVTFRSRDTVSGIPLKESIFHTKQAVPFNFIREIQDTVKNKQNVLKLSGYFMSSFC